MSGIELESPHKSIAVAQDFPCNIEGIGDLRTSWTGQKGVQEIQQNKLKEETQTAMQVRATELKVLAVECLRAFMEAGMENSDLSQVQKAIAMYAPHTELPSHPRTNTSMIANLWRKEKPGTSADAQENVRAPTCCSSNCSWRKTGDYVYSDHDAGEPPTARCISCWKYSHMLALIYSTVHRLIGKYLCMSSCARPIVQEKFLHSTSFMCEGKFPVSETYILYIVSRVSLVHRARQLCRIKMWLKICELE